MKYKYLSETINIKKVAESGNKGTFNIENLYTGYGVTLANSLRRVLISSLPGAAISQVKIKGVKHEFSTIPGVIEDVVEFTINLKKIRFHFFAEEPQVLRLKIKGVKEVKAGDIESSPMVRVINPELHLADLTSKKSDLDIELTVEKGLGYVPVEARKAERLPVGTIIIDSVFSPVTNVEFKVEDMRVGERTDYNRIIMSIETDGSITPTRALRQASNILKDHFDKISTVEGGEEVVEISDEPKPKKKTRKTAAKKTAKKSDKKK